ncbi:MAG TPA: RNase adapter RapZ [Acidimicrobiia bacterium]|nr:RNase adapter RapZ [Acidimicrobiia bacterium]
MTKKLQAHVVIVTGMSGAGRSEAANVLEDIGYFVVDNLPLDLVPNLVASVGVADGTRSKVAIVVDTRSGIDATTLDLALIDLQRAGIPTTVLFLDADDRVLVQRFEESRRPHPLPQSALLRSITAERETFEEVRAVADVIVDTSDLSVHQLRDQLHEAFASGSRPSMRVDVTSFGFKRGIPRVADLMFDVRFLPNPHWIADLRPKTGLDEDVREYVFSHDEARTFLSKVTDLLDFLIPEYEAEGKSYVTIGIGCTGGKHRSVAMAEAIGSHLSEQGFETAVHHRDMPV